MRQQRFPAPRPHRLGDTISDATVRGFYHKLLEIVGTLHDDVTLHHTEVDVRAEYEGCPICRLVPYRELIHLQIGDAPAWEIRIRDEQGFLEAVDRVLEKFVELASKSGAAASSGVPLPPFPATH
jgi:hypothetical protein